MDPTQICAGGGTLCPWGEESWLFCFGPEKTQKREESCLKNFWILIFLTVAQDEPYKIPVNYFSERFSEIIFKKCVNDSCQNEKPSRSKLSPEGQNEIALKLYNIIHAPADTSKHFLMEQTRLKTEETKGQATQGNSTWRTGMAGLFALSFVRDYAVFHPWKHCFIFILWLKWIALFGNLIVQPTYCKNKTWDTYRDLQIVIE